MIRREFVGGPMDGEIAEMFSAARTLYVPVNQPPGLMVNPLRDPGLPTARLPRLVGVYTMNEQGDLVWAGEVWR